MQLEMATNSTVRKSFWTFAVVGLALLAGRGGRAQTQSTPAVKIGGFTTDGYHPDPDHTRPGPGTPK